MALAALAAFAGIGVAPKAWLGEAATKAGRSPRATIRLNQRRWIARRRRDGIWRYDGRVTGGAK